MATTRTKNTIKHLRAHATHAAPSWNLALNALAGGVRETLAYKGVRLSGFIVSDYSPSGGGASITFGLGAFIQANTTGDYRGIIAHEPAAITLTAGDVAAGDELTLWGWVNNADEAGLDMNAYFQVTASDSPPIGHAVPLASTILGGTAGAYHWRPVGGVGLIDLNDRIDNLLSGGGTTRDFVVIAQNYQAANSSYAFMTFSDFGGVLGEYGAWIPTPGDEAKYDTDNRQLEQLGASNYTVSLPFDSDIFLKEDLTYYSLVGVRVLLVAVDETDGVIDPGLVFDSTVSILDQNGIELASIQNDDYDTDVTITSFSLEPPNSIRVKVKCASDTSRILRVIVLGRLG